MSNPIYLDPAAIIAPEDEYYDIYEFCRDKYDLRIYFDNSIATSYWCENSLSMDFSSNLRLSYVKCMEKEVKYLGAREWLIWEYAIKPHNFSSTICVKPLDAFEKIIKDYPELMIFPFLFSNRD